MLLEFLGRNFMSRLRTLKPKKPKNLKTSKNLGFPALIETRHALLLMLFKLVRPTRCYHCCYHCYLTNEIPLRVIDNYVI